MSIMLLLCSTNTHSVVHDKSRSTLQLNKGIKSNKMFEWDSDLYD